jgi:hypothetical protein
MDEPYLEIVYINPEDEDSEHHIMDVTYFEWHSIVESLKMTHNYIRKQIILGEDYGWDDTTKAPINKVSSKTVQQARAKATHIRKYMAARHQGKDGGSAIYNPELYSDEEDMPDA